MNNKEVQQTLSTISEAIGKGILAGLAGTAAITLSQMIEMQFTKRETSQTPAKVAGQVLGVVPSDKKQASELSGEEMEPEKSNEEVKQEHTERFTQMMHWQYGTSWGLGRSALSLAGVSGWPATALHFASVWGTALVMLPSANASKPITQWPPKQIASDILHHGIYALAAGSLFDYISQASDSTNNTND